MITREIDVVLRVRQIKKGDIHGLFLSARLVMILNIVEQIRIVHIMRYSVKMTRLSLNPIIQDQRISSNLIG